MIRTGYASDFKKKHPRPPNSGTVILITRGRPFAWLNYDEWKQVLSPQPKTLRKWLDSKRTEENRKVYLDDFQSQMKANEPTAAMNVLSQRIKKGETITLICYCKPEAHCHRYVIKSLLEPLL